MNSGWREYFIVFFGTVVLIGVKSAGMWMNIMFESLTADTAVDAKEYTLSGWRYMVGLGVVAGG